MKVRRIVTGVDHRGRSHIASDGPPPNSFAPPSGHGWRWTDIWALADTPATAADGGDVPADQVRLQPPPGGAKAIVLTLPPDAAMAAGDRARFGRELTALLPGLASTGEHDRQRSGFHRTDTIDIVTVISGELWLELDDGEAHLRAGDVIVQRGTAHAWRNRSGQPCTFSAVLLAVAAAPDQTGPVGGSRGQ